MTKWKKQKKRAELAANPDRNNREEEEEEPHWKQSKRPIKQQEQAEPEDQPEEEEEYPITSRTEDGVEVFSGGEEDDDEKAEKKKKKSGGFQSMNLSRNVFQGIFKKGYRLPTPIQRRAIPKALAGHDVVAMARTGSGKTAAFLIPLFEKLGSHSKTVGVRAVVLSPTRELAMQTLKFFKELGKFTDLRAALLVGGDNMEDQFSELARNPDVLIATPGRLLHHCIEAQLTLKTVTYLVFDEADRLFEMGFENDLRELLAQLSETRQTLLFSATMPKSLVGFVRAGLKDPVLIRLDTEATLSDRLALMFLNVRLEDKPAALIYLFKNVISDEEQTVVFVATRHHVEFLTHLLNEFGIAATSIYGSMDQTARKQHLLRFRKKQAKVLVVTDVAARGIDIPLLENVVNYDFPLKPKLFVHRAGRTARQNMSGTAYSLVSAEEMAYMVDLHLFLSKTLKNALNPNEKYDKKECSYGSIPQSLLDSQDELVREVVSRNVDLDGMQKVMMNAYKMYWKLAQNPSPESVRRAKDLPPIQPHPYFISVGLPLDEKASSNFLEKLRAFRPQLTVIEMQSRNTRTLPGKPGATDSSEVMRKKRAIHESIIRQKRAKRNTNNASSDPSMTNDDVISANEEASSTNAKEEDASSAHEVTVVTTTAAPTDDLASLSGKQGKKKRAHSFIDTEFFMDYTQKNSAKDKMLELDLRGGAGGRNSLEDMVLDVGGSDEKATLEKTRNKLQWDRKKKKYVQVSAAPGQRAVDLNSASLSQRKKLLNESGKRITSDKNKTKQYEKWKQRTKLRIPSAGERELSLPPMAKRRRGFPAPNQDVREELKNVDQIRKEKIHQERLQEKNKPKRNKDGEKKGGGRGGAQGGKKKFGGGGGSFTGGAKGGGPKGAKRTAGGSKAKYNAPKRKLPATKIRKNHKR